MKALGGFCTTFGYHRVTPVQLPNRNLTLKPKDGVAQTIAGHEARVDDDDATRPGQNHAFGLQLLALILEVAADAGEFHCHLDIDAVRH